jgi:tetratricopeptide (TPR) repeat protein
MRTLLYLVMTALLMALAPAAIALDYARSAAQSASLDALFADLASAPDEASARATADQIWSMWTQPDDPVLAARVEAIITGGGFAGPVAQFPLIDALVADYPDYAEGWNLRATANFLRGDNDAALADVVETLRREPRHFGALAGRALILHGQGKYEEALEAIKAALEIHPFLPERGLFPELGAPPIRS